MRHTFTRSTDGDRLCPSGAHAKCPTPMLCTEACHFQTAEGGRTFDSAIHEAPAAPRQPKTFQPDYGITHSRVKVTYHLTPMGWLVAFIAVCCFVWYAATRH